MAELIFKSMIQPLFYYCHSVFGEMNSSWLNKFESLIVRAKAIIKYNPNVPSFKTGLKRKIALDVFKALNGISLNKNYEVINHKYNTKRNRSSLRFPAIHSKAGRKLSYYQGAIVFNSLNDELRKESSYILFKRKIKNYNFSC